MKVNVIDEFKLVKFIGKGSYGKVYLTYHKNNNNETYATKIISKKKADSPGFQKYFNNEIIILKEINHINIIHLFTIRSDINNYYIITDYCNGGTLSNCLRKYMQKYGRAFSEEIVQYLMIQIVEAIKYLHGKRIIHRDIKLDNILVNFENEYDKKNLNMLKSQIKLIDFGFATHLNNSNETYSILGSPAYMDPIILKKYNLLIKYNINDKSIGYNEKVDIYSLGAVCYEMIIGRKIFNGKNEEEREKMVEDGNYFLPINLSKEIISFLNGMLQYDEKNRLSADELSRHLFLTKNVKDFTSINLSKVCHKLDFQGLNININIKNDQSIWDIIQEDDGNNLNNIPGNIFNEKPLPRQDDEYSQMHDINNIINNYANNTNNNNVLYEYQYYDYNNNQYCVGGVNSNTYNNNYINIHKSKYGNEKHLKENKYLNNNVYRYINPQSIPEINNIIMNQIPKNNQLLLNQHYQTYNQNQKFMDKKYTPPQSIDNPDIKKTMQNQERRTYVPFIKKFLTKNKLYQKNILIVLLLLLLKFI